MQIFNKKDNDIINLLNDLKLVQNRIDILIDESKKISNPPLYSFITSDERREVLDYLIPIVTGMYTLEDIKKDRVTNTERLLEGLKNIGIFLTNFSNNIEQYKDISGQIQDLKQQETSIKRKLGIS